MPKSAPTPTLHDEVTATLKRLQAKDPGLKRMLKNAHGYAVFPSVGKASAVIGGAYGRGEAYEKGELIGYATLSQLTLGVQLGGDTFSEILIFEGKEALDRFKRGKTAFAANASAVMVKAGAAGTKNPEKGVQAFAYSRGGMLLELAIGGQKFTFKPVDDGDQGDEEGEGQEGREQGSGTGLAGRAMGGIRAAASMAREHPVAATVIGVGVAAGVGLLVARRLRSGASSDEEGDGQEQGQDDEDQDRPDEEMSADDEGQEDDEGRDQDDNADEEEGDDDTDAQGRGGTEEDEGDEQDERGGGRQRSGGVLGRILGRSRARS